MPKIKEMAHMVLSKGFNSTAKCKQGQCNHYAADIYPSLCPTILLTWKISPINIEGSGIRS